MRSFLGLSGSGWSIEGGMVDGWFWWYQEVFWLGQQEERPCAFGAQAWLPSFRLDGRIFLRGLCGQLPWL